MSNLERCHGVGSRLSIYKVDNRCRAQLEGCNGKIVCHLW